MSDIKKLCTYCNEIKMQNEFNYNKSTKDKLQPYCKICLKNLYLLRCGKIDSYPRIYQKPISLKEQGISKCHKCKKYKHYDEFYKDSNKSSGCASKCKKCHNEWKSNRRKVLVTHSKYLQLRHASKSRKHECTLTEEEFEILFYQLCVYCGGITKGGLDRLDTHGGYTKENSQPCCIFCNRMKMDHLESEFLKKVIEIAKYRNLI